MLDIDAIRNPASGKLEDAYCDFRDHGEFFDGAFMSSDGVKFEVHKSFIVLKNAVLGRMFTYTTGDNIVTLDITSDHLRTILDHFYSKRSDEELINENNVVEIFKIAAEYGMASLMAACRKLFVQNLDVQNCLGIWRFAGTYGCPILLDDAYRFFKRSFAEVYQTSEEFLELTKEELEEILEDDRMSTPREQDLLDALGRWVLHDPALRAEDGVALLDKIRFGIMMNSKCFYPTRKQMKKEYTNLKTWNVWVAKFKATKAGYRRNAEGDRPVSFHLRNELYRPRIPSLAIFTIGGWSGGAPTSVVEVYDLRANKWFQLPAASPNFLRAYHGTIVIGTKIYIFGGYDGASFYNSMHMLDAANLEQGWTTLSCMNHARCYVTCCLFRGDIWAFGGLDGTNRVPTVERYNVARNQWDLMPPMRVARSDGSAVVHNGRIFVCGGFDGENVLNTIEYFDEDKRLWNFGARMQLKRSGLSSLSYRGHLTVLGGFNGERRTNRVEYYDDRDMCWKRLPDMNLAKSNFTTIIIGEKLYTFGGYDGGRTVSTVECFDPSREAGHEWVFLQPMDLPKSALGVVVLPECPRQYSYLQYLEQMDEAVNEDREESGGSRNVSTVVHGAGEAMDQDESTTDTSSEEETSDGRMDGADRAALVQEQGTHGSVDNQHQLQQAVDESQNGSSDEEYDGGDEYSYDEFDFEEAYSDGEEDIELGADELVLEEDAPERDL
jgi:kelch-like protein 10